MNASISQLGVLLTIKNASLVVEIRPPKSTRAGIVYKQMMGPHTGGWYIFIARQMGFHHFEA